MALPLLVGKCNQFNFCTMFNSLIIIILQQLNFCKLMKISNFTRKPHKFSLLSLCAPALRGCPRSLLPYLYLGVSFSTNIDMPRLNRW